MFSIRDAKAESFNPPFFHTTHGEAERSFRTAVSDPKTVFNQYPDDFDMYYVGEFDTNTGKFDVLKTPLHVVKAVQCLPKKVASPLLESQA